MTQLTPGALAMQGYLCSACLEAADLCRCPWRETHGIDKRPPLIHRDTLAKAALVEVGSRPPRNPR